MGATVVAFAVPAALAAGPVARAQQPRRGGPWALAAPLAGRSVTLQARGFGERRPELPNVLDIVDAPPDVAGWTCACAGSSSGPTVGACARTVNHWALSAMTSGPVGVRLCA